jgi:hypothetical protein
LRRKQGARASHLVCGTKAGQSWAVAKLSTKVNQKRQKTFSQRSLDKGGFIEAWQFTAWEGSENAFRPVSDGMIQLGGS